MVLLLGLACLAQGPSRANDRKPESGAGGKATGAGPASESSGVLELQVVSRQTKEPLAGVDLEIRISSQTRKEVTNEQGRCRIEYGRPQPDYFSIRASKQGLVPMQVAWRPGESRTRIPESFILTLEPGTTIGGTIQDEDGKPIEGATVCLLVPADSGSGIERVAIWDQRQKTDAAGRWRCDMMPAKLDDLWIRLEHPDYISDEMYGKTPKPPMERLRDMTGVMVMKKGVAVTGRVLDAEGQPIAGASVAQGSDRFGTEYPSTQTDQEGRFQFRNVRPGEMILTVQAAGRAPDLKQIAVQKGVEPVEFRLERGRTLKGQVVDKAGNPVAGAFVAVDTWRGHRSLRWRVDTDAQGRFQWDDAPADEVLVDLGKQHYMSMRRNPMTASDKEYVITMYPVLQIHGRVVDKETGQPIPKFTVIPGIEFGNGQPVLWERGQRRAFVDGQYEISLSEPYRGRLLRIEAEGCLPEASRVFDASEGQVAFDVSLKKGAGPSGTVCLADGTPASGAEVILCTGSRGVFIRNGRNERNLDNVSVETGPDGRFSLPPQTDPFVLVVLHDKGYTEVTADELNASSRVTLPPWGRVEGKVLIGSKAGAGQDVELLPERPRESGGPRINYESSAVTDKDGHFVLERVVPGRVQVCRAIRVSERSRRFSQLTPLDVKAGETATVTLGGTGRPVLGKVVIPEDVKDKVDRESLDYFIRDQSGGGLSRVWAFKLESDGTFRAEDIPAGDYCFYLYAFSPPTTPRAFRGEQVGSLTHPFTIADMPGGRSDEPLDLGVLELPIAGALASASSLIGKPAPDLKTLKLEISADRTAGQRLLVCFFDMDQRPSRNTVLQLAKRAGELKDQGIVTVAVQGSQADEAKLKDWVEQNAIPFPTGRIQGDENKIRFAWGVRSLPWLILTDKDHIVRAEGFSLDELDGMLARAAEVRK
jgi:protocatechuate 3,4-dioxygenase beta subunit